MSNLTLVHIDQFLRFKKYIRRPSCIPIVMQNELVGMSVRGGGNGLLKNPCRNSTEIVSRAAAKHTTVAVDVQQKGPG